MILKLKPEVKQMWTTALRSGEFKQTRATLRDGNGGMCCLGVLCELHRRATGDELAELWESDCVYGDESYTPPLSVHEWALTSSPDASYPIGGLQFRERVTEDPSDRTDAGLRRSLLLSEANDNGSTFNEIANAIDKYL